MATATPASKVNHIGLPILEYRGGKSTLCAGCGHNAISERIIDALFEMGIEPERVMKMSGIGCSSKSPAYFLGRAHAFNGVHGRMPAISTGAVLANHTMTTIGVSGDGDTASIGMGQFIHLMRRNLPMIYIIEDNGVYGLTKGQFSATADLGSRLKTGVVNDLPAIDICALAIQLGATFVGRSFSGDKKQLLSMLKAALAHKGGAQLDGQGANVDSGQIVDHAGLEPGAEICGGRELALGKPVDAVVFNDVDHGQIAAHEVNELSHADGGGVAVAGDANGGHGVVGQDGAGGDGRHTPMHAVKCMGAAQEVGGALGGAADAAHLHHALRLDAHLE